MSSDLQRTAKGATEKRAWIIYTCQNVDAKFFLPWYKNEVAVTVKCHTADCNWLQKCIFVWEVGVTRPSSGMATKNLYLTKNFEEYYKIFKKWSVGSHPPNPLMVPNSNLLSWASGKPLQNLWSVLAGTRWTIDL